MNYPRANRKYPRMHKRNSESGEEGSIDISLGLAAGILAAAFVKGIFWGYMIKRAMD